MFRNDPVILERRYVSKGSAIINQGDEGNTAFLIQSGSVRIFTETADGRQVELSRIGVGQIFGEMSLINDGPRMASAEALEDCNLIIISRETLQQKLNHSDPTIKALLLMMLRRIANANTTLLKKEGSTEDLIEVANNLYQMLHAGLPRQQQASLESTVLPKLEDFLKAVKAFQARYPENDKD